MKTKSFPRPPDEVLKDILPLFHDFLEPGLLYGIDEANKFFEERRSSHDPWLYSNIVRFEMKRWLLRNDIEKRGFRLLNPPLTGIWLESEKFRLRIWKNERAVDPNTHEQVSRLGASSQARKYFFFQPHFEFEVDDQDLGDPLLFHPTKLVAIWDLDGSGRPRPFELACPSKFDDDLRQALVHWRVPVPPKRESLGDADIIGEVGQLLEDLDFGNEDFGSGDGEADLR